MSTERVSLKGFMLLVVLLLPLAFFLWFYLAAVLVVPVQLALAAALELVLGEAVDGVSRQAYLLQAGVIVSLPEGRAVAEIPINPMIYGYGLPLVAGLVGATPIAALRRGVQLLVVYLAVVVVQTWGAFWEIFRTVAFNLGEPGGALLAATPMSRELIALCYQFGYLVLPAVVPVALWILLNRTFIEGVVARRIEPGRPSQGQ